MASNLERQGEEKLRLRPLPEIFPSMFIGLSKRNDKEMDSKATINQSMVLQQQRGYLSFLSKLFAFFFFHLLTKEIHKKWTQYYLQTKKETSNSFCITTILFQILGDAVKKQRAHNAREIISRIALNNIENVNSSITRLVYSRAEIILLLQISLKINNFLFFIVFSCLVSSRRYGVKTSTSTTETQAIDASNNVTNYLVLCQI